MATITLEREGKRHAVETTQERGAALLAVILAVVGLGFITPALGTETSGESVPYTLATGLSNAYLTKVIDAAPGYQAQQDTYTFHFEGRDKAAATECKIFDYAVTGKALPNASGNGDHSLQQIAVQVPLAAILTGTEGNRTPPKFPNAGIYEYVVTETSATNNGGGTAENPVYVNKSNAEYILRVYVKNVTNGGQDELAIDGVTVEKMKDDDGEYLTDGQGNPLLDDQGNHVGEKVDPVQPTVDGNNSITGDGVSNHNNNGIIGTDGRGRDVNGFTFANEYVSGGPVTVTKRITGTFADKTKRFPISITIHDNAAIDGAAISYNVSAGVADETKGKEPLDGDHGVNSYSGDSMIAFKNGEKEVTITARMTDGDTINITGLWGTLSTESYYNGNSQTADHRIRFTAGLKQGTRFTISESEFGDYNPSFSATSNGTSPQSIDLTALGLGVDSNIRSEEGKVAENGAVITVTNELFDTMVDRTGIIINNLPYVLMVGVPLVVFALLFVAKRRSRTDA